MYKYPRAHSGQPTFLKWALFKCLGWCKQTWCLSFLLGVCEENGKLYSRLVEIQYLFWAVPSPPFSYERSCKVPHPDLTCFGKFNKPLWWKQGIAQRPVDFIWYLLLIPQGLSSDTHVDSLRNCRNFCSVLCTEKKKKENLWWPFVWKPVAHSFCFIIFLEKLNFSDNFQVNSVKYFMHNTKRLVKI